MMTVSGACSTASFSSGARQRAGEIVVGEKTTRDGGGHERADGRGDGAGQLVAFEFPAAVEARNELKTMQGEDDKDKVRFTTIHHHQA